MKWEYMEKTAEQTNLITVANVQGDLGWELVSVCLVSISFAYGNHFQLYFKRRKQEEGK